MERNVKRLGGQSYDLVIIGGGIYGACVAWDAILRGLSVGLVEKGDFACGTSANSLKIIHGGLRHLQRADFKRMREAVHERTTLMRIAPHLVHPLPFLIPTYGHGMQSREVLSLALMVNDLISFDRNRLGDAQKHIPRGRFIPRGEVLQLFPGIHHEGLTGGALFYDAQVSNSERLVLSFLRAAAEAGAEIANYVKATGFLKQNNTVTGITAIDSLSDDRFDIKARMVVNTAGPWVDSVLNSLNGSRPAQSFAKAINLVTRSLFQQTYAIGMSGRNGSRQVGAMIKKHSPMLFFTPWRGRSLIGTSYVPHNGNPDHLKVTEEEIQSFVAEINRACPGANLELDEVSFVHGGLIPSLGACKAGRIRLIQRHRIFDRVDHGVNGLISVIGAKYTMARHVAEKVVDRVFESRQQTPPKSRTSVTPIHGGEIENFGTFLQHGSRSIPNGFDNGTGHRLLINYGSAHRKVLSYLDKSSVANGNGFSALRAEVLHGIREEMAQTLSDVVFRRTELGTSGHPGYDSLRVCAEEMRKELGWSDNRTMRELQEVNESFSILN